MDDLEKVQITAPLEPEEFTISQIFADLLLSEGELIVVIPKLEDNKLRKGLSALKAKQNAKLRENGIEADGTKLEFIVIEDKALPKELVRLRILLKEPSTVRVYEKLIPDGEL